MKPGIALNFIPRGISMHLFLTSKHHLLCIDSYRKLARRCVYDVIVGEHKRTASHGGLSDDWSIDICQCHTLCRTAELSLYSHRFVSY